jgi:hypothetical protein
MSTHMFNKGDIFTTAAGGMFRILGVEEGTRPNTRVVHVFGMEDPKSLPKQWTHEELTDGLKTGLYERQRTTQMAIVVAAPSVAEAANATAAEKLRETRWELIKPLVANQLIYWRQHRGKLVEARAKETGASEQTLMTCLRLYWRGGMTKDALLGGYAQCGTPKDPVNVDASLPRGRKPRNQRYEVFRWPDAAEKRKVLATAMRFFKKKKTNSRHLIYRTVVRKHYSVQGADGKLKMRPLGERPSPAQVLYLLDKHQSLESVLRRKHGDDNFENNVQPKTGSARNYANGVGQYYEIDSTIPDVWICAEDNPATVIGKATLYLIVDVYSRLIVGFHLTLDSPSWSSALEAMMSLVEDKRELCKRWGFEYRDEDWLAHGVWPAFFRADRGPEFTGHDSDTIAEGLETGLINVPRRRAPRKGTVECTFKLVHVPLKDHVGGYTLAADIGKRQTDDGKGEATRTLKSVGQEILAAIRLHNQKVHKRVELPAADIYRGLQPIPSAMWKRDYEERSGMLTRYSADYMRFKLLPRSDKFTVTPSGVFFKGLVWEPGAASKQKWLLPATRKPYEVSASYHRNLVDVIYVHDKKDPTKWTTMTLAPRSLQHLGKSFAEFESVKEARLTLNELGEEHNLSLLIQHDEEAEAREKEARAAATAALRRAGGRSRTNGAVEMRDAEAKRNRAAMKTLATTAVDSGTSVPSPASVRPAAPPSPATNASALSTSNASTSANAALQVLLNLRKKP